VSYPVERGVFTLGLGGLKKGGGIKEPPGKGNGGTWTGGEIATSSIPDSERRKKGGVPPRAVYQDNGKKPVRKGNCL